MGCKATGQIPQNKNTLRVINVPAVCLGIHRWLCWTRGVGLHEALVRPGMFLAQWYCLLVVKLDTKARTQVLKAPSVKALRGFCV